MGRFDDRVKEVGNSWAKRRHRYNKGLIISGFAAFLLYCFVGSFLFKDFEVTLFTIFFQSIGYIIMMLVANLFYGLGAFIDLHYNQRGDEDLRNKL